MSSASDKTSHLKKAATTRNYLAARPRVSVSESPLFLAASRLLWMCFITAGPITKLFAWGGRRVEDRVVRTAATPCDP
jgi:hypothetical protein